MRRLPSDFLGDGYTDSPTKARIVREGDDEYPWVLDAYDHETGEYSQTVLTFASWNEAIAEIPNLIRLIQR